MERGPNQELLAEAFQLLRTLLVERAGLILQHCFDGFHDGGEVWWQITANDLVCCRVVVEAHDPFTLRTMHELAYLTPANLRQMQRPTVLVVAPWLSPRCREVIDERGWSYFDLAGNLQLRSYQPAIYVRLEGADRNPQPRPGDVPLRGGRINALVRLLADAAPPYRARELATAAGLSESYVSRALRSLQEHGFVDRAGSGRIIEVNWAELLRERACEYGLLRDNRSMGFASPAGPRAFLDRLRDEADAVVTGAYAAGTDATAQLDAGSYAAAQLAAESDAAAQLAMYVPEIRAFARRHDLRAARHDADVLLIEPASVSQVQRCRSVDGVRYAGYSQLAQDLLADDACLRPCGEALLERMALDPSWRLPALPTEGSGERD